jgi:hypothetical protein
MYYDLIINEVRKAGEELSNEAGGNIHTFFATLRLTEAKYTERLTDNIALTLVFMPNKIKINSENDTSSTCFK